MSRIKNAVMSGRSLAFLVTILVVLLIIYRPAKFFRSNGDVLGYERYAVAALKQPIELPLEYPPLSTAIFVVPQLILPHRYMIGFAIFAALALWLTVLAVDHLTRRGWWLLLYIVLGAWGIVFFRFDIFVVLVTVLAYAAGAKRRWVLAQALIGIGVALKLYPLILMPLIVLWQWRETRRWSWQPVLSSAAWVVFAFGSMWLVGPTQLAGMLQFHRDRPLEIEALGASLLWLLQPTTVELTFGSVNLAASQAPRIIFLMTGATGLLLCLVYTWFLLGRLRPATAWALVLLFSVATSKVFSTQYLLWVLPFVVLASEDVENAAANKQVVWSRGLWILICVLTTLIFPVAFLIYDAFFWRAETPPVLMTIVTVRNLLWVVACFLAVRYWSGSPTHVPDLVTTKPNAYLP